MRLISEEGDELILVLESEDDADTLGARLGARMAPGTVLGLIGTLGAGKTRLSRAIATALDVDPTTITSPTFVLIHEYDGALPVYHFDTYRLPNPEAFEALGASEYWSRADGICLIEWADRVRDLLPENCWTAELTIESVGARRVKLTIPGQTKLAAWLGFERERA